eukprot:4142657-Amphidinium_carterae.1
MDHKSDLQLRVEEHGCVVAASTEAAGSQDLTIVLLPNVRGILRAVHGPLKEAHAVAILSGIRLRQLHKHCPLCFAHKVRPADIIVPDAQNLSFPVASKAHHQGQQKLEALKWRHRRK